MQALCGVSVIKVDAYDFCLSDAAIEEDRRHVEAVDRVPAVRAIPVRVGEADVRGHVLGAVEEARAQRVRVAREGPTSKLARSEDGALR